MKSQKNCWATWIDQDGNEHTEQGIVEYIGHSWEYVATPVSRMVDGFLIEKYDKIPMQVVVYVIRIVSTGEVIRLKPEGVRYSPAGTFDSKPE